MNRAFVIDLPALLQGNLHQVDISLLHETLHQLKGIKNVEILFNNEDQTFLAQNEDFAFAYNVWQFLSDVSVRVYDDSARKDKLTYAPPNIDTGLDKNLKDAIYLQLCVIHVQDNPLGTISFVGFMPRFKEVFQLETTRDKKSRKHHTKIFSNCTEMKSWIDSYKPHLEQKKHKGEETNSSMGNVSPFQSYYKLGEKYADSLLQKAYLESDDSDEFPHYLYTWDAEAGTFVQFRHENHEGDSHHNYHGMDLSPMDYDKVPKHIRMKYHR